MSDNQSDNTDAWGAESALAHRECTDAINAPLTTEPIRRQLSPQEAAERQVQAAEQAVYQAKEALLEAKMDLTKAQGRLWIITNRPTWKDILRIGNSFTTMEAVYTACMQMGYQAALVYGKIYRAGNPSEGMVDTGLREDDIP